MGKWEDYTGTFFITDEDKKKFVIDKAEAHYNRFFAEQYPDKEFAIVVKINKKNTIEKILNKQN